MRPKDPRFSDPTEKNRTTLATPAKKNCFFERRFPELHRCRHLRTCWRTHEVSFSIARRQDEQNRSAALHRTGRAAPRRRCTQRRGSSGVVGFEEGVPRPIRLAPRCLDAG